MRKPFITKLSSCCFLHKNSLFASYARKLDTFSLYFTLDLDITGRKPVIDAPAA